MPIDPKGRAPGGPPGHRSGGDPSAATPSRSNDALRDDSWAEVTGAHSDFDVAPVTMSEDVIQVVDDVLDVGLEAPPALPSRTRLPSLGSAPAAPPPLPPRAPGVDGERAATLGTPSYTSLRVEEEDVLAPEVLVTPTVLESARAAAGAISAADEAARLAALVQGAASRREQAHFGFAHGTWLELAKRDEAAALRAYGAAVQADPGFAPPLAALRRTFTRRALWPNLTKLLDAETTAARDDARRAALWTERGWVLGRAGDLRGAEVAWRQALTFESDHRPALAFLERALAKDPNRATELGAIHEAFEYATLDPRRRAGIAWHRARALLRRDAASARGVCETLGQLADTTADLSGEITQSWCVAAAIAGDPAGSERAQAARLTHLKRRHGALTDAGAPIAAASIAARWKTVARRLSRLAVAAGRPQDAWTLLTEAAVLAPEDALLLEDMATLAHAQGWHEATVQLQAALAAHAPEAARRLGISPAAASDGGDVETSEPFPDLAQRLEQAAARGDFAELASGFSREAELAATGHAFQGSSASDPAWAASAQTAAGDVLRYLLGDPALALAAYRKALEYSPGHAAGTWALVFCAWSQGDLSTAAGILSSQAHVLAKGTPHGEREILELAWAASLGGDDVVAAALRLHEADPTDEPLLWRTLATARDALARGACDPQIVVRLVARLAELTAAGPARAALHREAASLLLPTDPERSLKLLMQARAASMSCTLTFEALSQLLFTQGNFEGLATLWEEEAQRLELTESQPAVVARHFRDASQVVLLALGDEARALRLLERARERSPDDPWLRRAVIDAASSAQPALAVPLLEAEVDAQTGEAAAWAALELADVAGRAGQAGLTHSALERAASAPAVAAHACWARFEWACRAGDPVSVRDAWSRVLGAAATPDLLAAVVAEPGMTKLSSDATPASFAESLAGFLGAVRHHDADAQAQWLPWLRDLCPDPRLRSVLERRCAQMTGGKDERAAWAEQAATGGVPASPADQSRAARELLRMGRLHDAGQILGRVLSETPMDKEALLLLRRLARLSDDHETQARACIDLADAFQHPETQARFLAQAAQILGQELGQPLLAAALWSEVVVRMPRHEEAFAQAHAILSEHGCHTRLVELISRRITQDASPAERGGMVLLRAEANRRRGAIDAATADATEALVLIPGHPGARELLALLQSLPKRVVLHPPVERTVPAIARANTQGFIPLEPVPETSDRDALMQQFAQNSLDTDVLRRLLPLTHGDARRQVLARALGSARGALSSAPNAPRAWRRLMNVGAVAEDADLVYLAMGGLLAVGTKHDNLLRAYRTRRDAFLNERRTPARPIAATEWKSLRHPDAQGFLTELWETLAPVLHRLAPHEPSLLGFRAEQELPTKTLGARFPHLATLLYGCGLADARVFVSEERHGFFRALTLAHPVLYLGADVAAAQGPHTRFLLGRALAQARGRSGALSFLNDAELALTLAAVWRTLGGQPSEIPALATAAEDPARVGARLAFLETHMDKLDRQAIRTAGQNLNSPFNLAVWRRGMQATALRGALLLTGDLVAIADSFATQGADPAKNPEVQDLLVWAVNDVHLELRKELGLS